MSVNIQYPELFETILNILAIAVLVDQKERDKELVEFYHCAALLNQKLHPDNILARGDVQAWYRSRKSFLNSMLRSENSHKFQRDMLTKIGDVGLQRAVLIAIFAISVADHELADMEKEFLQLALDVWKNPLPNSAEIHVHD